MVALLSFTRAIATTFVLLQHGLCDSDVLTDALLIDARVLPRGSASNLDREFAFVNNQTLMERQLTCPSGYGLCPNSNLCAQIGGRCCDDKVHTCRAGYVCCGSGCTPTDDYCCPNIINSDYHGCDSSIGLCCGSQCMYRGSTCCPNVSNNDRHGCLAGYNCCGDNCSPSEGQCCKTGKYCPKGYWCVLYQGVQKCCDGLLCAGDYNPSYVAVPARPAVATVVPGAAPNTNAPAISSPTVAGGAVSTPAAATTPATTPTSTSTSARTAGYYTFTLTLSNYEAVYTGTGSRFLYSGGSTVVATSTVSFYATGYTLASLSAQAWAISHMTLLTTSITVAAASTATPSSAAVAAATTSGSGQASVGTQTTVDRVAGLMMVGTLLVATLMVVL